MFRCAALLLVVHLIASDKIENVDENCGLWRLPRTVLPTHYDISLKIPGDPTAKTFTGATNITLKCIEGTNTITLNSKELNITIDSIHLQAENVVDVKVVKTRLDPKYEMIHLTLEPPLSEGRILVLSIPEYIGQINEDGGRGLFRNVGRNGRVMYGTFLQPAFARMVFPCFDEPNMKANFTISVVRPARFSSHSNMPIRVSSTIGTDWFMDTFEETPTMSTYTLGVAVYTHPNHTTYGSGRAHIMLPQDNNDNVDLKFVHRVAKDALEELEKYTGIPYHLPKLDHVVLTEYEFDGMEHWGIVMYARRVFQNTAVSATEKKLLLETVIHETAHQWFGNLVTMDWWSYLWLNEAISTYLQYTIGKKILPEWDLEKQFLQELQNAFDYDREQNGVVLPLTYYKVCHVPDTYKYLTAVSYDKGASILRMFETIIGGEDYFREALSLYLNRRMMKTSKPRDLFDALDEVNGKLPKSRLPQNVTFKDVAEAWTEDPGFPLVTIFRDYESKTARIRQERFFYNFMQRTVRSRWWIPLTLATPSSSHPDEPIRWVFEDETIHLDAAPDEWVLANVNATGFYRVNYDNQNWIMLARALETSPQLFSVANRAQLLDDAVALTKAGWLDLEITLMLTRFLLHEEDRFVWIRAERNLRMLWEHENSFSSYFTTKAHIRKLLTKAYSIVRTTRKRYEETPMDAAMRETLQDFACEIAVISCYSDRYLSWMPHWLQNII